jgi:ABC-2 type transport system permease protein
MVLATANVYFRDTQHLLSLVTQTWFYATPIIYPATYVLDQLASADAPDWLWQAYQLNPMLPFVDIFRALLYDNRMPDMADVTMAAGWTAGALIAGSLVFSRHEREFAEEL